MSQRKGYLDFKIDLLVLRKIFADFRKNLS